MSLVNYSPGDTIQSILVPFIKTSNHGKSLESKICEECFSDCSGFDFPICICEGCGRMKYCCPACRLTDWNNGHALECKSKTFAKNFNFNLKSHLFRTMCFFVFNSGQGEVKFDLYNGQSRSYNDLLSHFEDWKGAGKLNKMSLQLREACDSLAEDVAVEKLQTGNIVADSDYFLTLAGIFLTNGFTIYNEDETREIGSGIFIQSSVFNHSCKPTATFSVRGTRLEVRAIAPIKKGEEPSISYLAANMCRERRQRILLERYHFACDCVQCCGKENIDYDKLNRLIDFVSGCTLESIQDVAEPNESTVDRIICTHQKIVDMMGEIYYEYDTRVTAQWSRTVHALVNCTARNPNILSSTTWIREMITNTKDRLKITCGKDHPEYIKFEHLITGIY